MRHKTDAVRNQQLTHKPYKSTEIIVFFSDKTRDNTQKKLWVFLPFFSDPKEEINK